MADWYSVDIRFKVRPTTDQLANLKIGLNDRDTPKEFDKPFLESVFEWRNPMIDLKKDLLVIFKGLGIDAEVRAAFQGHDFDFNIEEELFGIPWSNNYDLSDEFVKTHSAWKSFRKNLRRHKLYERFKRTKNESSS